MKPEDEHNPKETQREEGKPRDVITYKTDPAAIDRAQKQERERVSGIGQLARKYNIEDDVVRDYTENGKSLSEFQNFLLTERMDAQPVDSGSSELGMSRKEKEQYSIVRAIHQQANGKFDGLEAEASREMAKVLGREADGFFVPTDIAGIDRQLVAGTPGDGGYTVAEDVLGGSMVELLRNKMLLNKLGARTLSGLRGDVAIPTVTGGATAYWLDETTDVTPKEQSFDQIALTPHRLGAATPFSKQLLAQSSISVESFVRDDLMRVLAIAKDKAGIEGTGINNQPTGIVNTSNVGSVTFSAAATFAKMVEFETKVATENADVANMSYITTPAVRGALKTTETASSNGIFIWDKDGVNGYNAEVTNQISSNKVIFGNFADCLFADWEGMDIVVDPYSLKKNGQIEICIQLMTDFAVRHAESFAVSTDAGNQ